MNFVNDVNANNSLPNRSVSCGDRSRSSCGSDVNVKRDHAATEKSNNS